MDIFMHIFYDKCEQGFLVGTYLQSALFSSQYYTLIHSDTDKSSSKMFYHFSLPQTPNESFSYICPCQILVVSES